MATLPWNVRLDRKLSLVGAYVDPNTTWTLPFNDNTIDTVVLSDDFGWQSGKIITPTRPTVTTLVAAGDYSAGCALVGRLYEFSIELSRPFMRNFEGVARLDVYTTFRKVIATYRKSGPFTLKAVMTGFTDRTKTFTQDDGSISAEDVLDTLEEWFTGPADQMQIFITSTSAKPVVIPSVELKLDHEPRSGDR